MQQIKQSLGRPGHEKPQSLDELVKSLTPEGVEITSGHWARAAHLVSFFSIFFKCWVVTNIWYVYQRVCYVNFNDKYGDNSTGAPASTAASAPDEDFASILPVPDMFPAPDMFPVADMLPVPAIATGAGAEAIPKAYRSNQFWNFVNDDISQLHETAGEDCETEEEKKDFIQE